MGIIELAGLIAAEHETRNPITIANNLGIVVHCHTLRECRGYYMKALDQHYITIAVDLPKMVKMFVCAHEIGHFLLHQRINRLFMDYRTYMIPDRFENEADKFAAQLLFSQPMLSPDFSVSESEMAEILNVPKNNVSTRLIELGVYF